MVSKATVQKESPKQSLPKVTSEAAVRNVLQNSCSSKFRNIHKETPVLKPYGL